MAVAKKGRRKIVRNGREFYWCVKDDEFYPNLSIVSKDNKFIVSYPLWRSRMHDEVAPYHFFIINIGKAFKGLEDAGHFHERFIVPDWEDEFVTPSLVANIIDWCFIVEDVTAVDYLGNILKNRQDGKVKWNKNEGWILADYLDIYNRYPANTFLSKVDRKERYELLEKWRFTDYQIMPKLGEVIGFMKVNDHLKYQQPFFVKVLFPRIEDDIENGNVEGIRFLFGYQEVYSYTNNSPHWASFITTFCNEMYPKYESINLANMLLAVEPDHEKALIRNSLLIFLPTNKFFINFHLEKFGKKCRF